MLIYRLGTSAHPIWDGSGASLFGGRWNPVGVPVIYAAGSLALAMLERLVQRRGLLETVLVEARVPDDLEIEDAMKAPPAGWRDPDSSPAAQVGARWVAGRRTALLRVPSALVPREANYVVNPAHEAAGRIAVTDPEFLEWGPRLFGIPGPVPGPGTTPSGGP